MDRAASGPDFSRGCEFTAGVWKRQQWQSGQSGHTGGELHDHGDGDLGIDYTHDGRESYRAVMAAPMK